MDEASWSATRLLETLQDAQAELREVRAYYMKLGLKAAHPRLELSGRPYKLIAGAMQRTFAGSITLGVIVTGCDGLPYDLVVDLRWDDCSWTIATSIWVEADAGGERLLRELDDRSAGSMGALRELVLSAAGDLRGFADLIPASRREGQPSS